MFYICILFFHLMKPEHAFQEWTVHHSNSWRAVHQWDLTSISPKSIPSKHGEHILLHSPYPSQLPPVVTDKIAEVIWAGFWFFLLGYWDSCISNINNFVLLNYVFIIKFIMLSWLRHRCTTTLSLLCSWKSIGLKDGMVNWFEGHTELGVKVRCLSRCLKL